jgi:hypothetical protein
MRTAHALSFGAVVALSMGMSSQARATGKCTENFDSQYGLTWTYANARSSFTVCTAVKYDKIVSCSDAPIGSESWYYRHPCGTNHLNVAPEWYGHFHLSFSNPAMYECPLGNPGDGLGAATMKKVNGQCVFPDWTREPRVLNTHDEVQPIRIYMTEARTGYWILFNMNRIRIGGTKSVHLSYFKEGQWTEVGLLAPGNHPLANVKNVEVVSVRGDGVCCGPIEITDFDIEDVGAGYTQDD